MTPRAGGQEFLFTRDFDPDEQYDIFVVGSSHAYRGYDPRVFQKHHFRLFNAGSSAQHPVVTGLVLKNMLPQIKKKPFVIIDVYDRILELDFQESSGRMMMNCSDPNLAKQILFYRLDVVTINNFISRILKSPDLKEVEIKDYVQDGYCMRRDTLDVELDPFTQEFVLNLDAVNGLETCLNWLNMQGYSFVLVSHPMPKQSGFEAYHTPAAKVIESMATRQGAYFLDFTELSDFSEHRYYFSDETHLNQQGVEAFNGILLDSLFALSVLKQPAIP
jgi:hypothetical protein